MTDKLSIEERMTQLEEQSVADKAIIAAQAKMLKKMENPGIQSVRDNKKPAIVPFTTEQNAERELRRYIKYAGNMVKNKFGTVTPVRAGFRKGLSDDKKKRAEVLLRLLGRVKTAGGKEVFDMKWDETILDPKNHMPPVTGEDE